MVRRGYAARHEHLQALIFDVDGTLADTERDGHRAAFNAAFAEAGLAWHWDVALYGELLAVTGGKERMRFYCGTPRPGFPGPRRCRRTDQGPARHQDARITCALLEGGGIPLRPGVARLIDEARAAGLRLAIATTTTPGERRPRCSRPAWRRMRPTGSR